MRWFCVALSTTLLVAVISPPASAQLTSPRVGWEADFNELFHDVSGKVSVLDSNTLLFDGFTYDGEGPAVYFYLGTEDSQPAFELGLSIGMLLSGTVYDGTEPPFEVDLPAGQTMEDWNAISVWCVDFQANFGSGAFTMPGDFDSDGDVDGDDFLAWQRAPGVGLFLDWVANYGTVVAPLSISAAMVPEPTTYAIAVAALCLVMGRRLSPSRISRLCSTDTIYHPLDTVSEIVHIRVRTTWSLLVKATESCRWNIAIIPSNGKHRLSTWDRNLRRAKRVGLLFPGSFR